MKKVVKYDYCTNKLLAVYDSISEASKQNKDETITKVARMCERRNGLHSPRRPYYFRWYGEPPEPHTCIACYDLDFELIDRYYSITEACKKTGLNWSALCNHLKNNRGIELRNRKQRPTSGLYFVYEEVK